MSTTATLFNGGFDLPASSDPSLQNVFKKQLQIIKQCKRKGVDLGSCLAEHSLAYDDLLYSNYGLESQFEYGSYPRLEDFAVETHAKRIPVVSFFSGAGGLDLGFEAAGFSHVAAVEVNEIFCATLRLNRPTWTVLGPPDSSGDVSNFEEMRLQLRKLIGRTRFSGVFIGGPPCQPFSIAANQRFSKNGKDFKRVGYAHEKNGNLLFDYIGLILEFKPAVFLIENVPGLYDVDGGEQLDKAISLLSGAGYNVAPPNIMNASEYGVPQSRKRLFIIGSRIKRAYLPPSKYGRIVPCGSVFKQKISATTANHLTRSHKAESIERYMKLRYGERDQLGRVDRLDPRLPSKTIIAGGTAGGGRSHLHPFIPRTLSVRECARLQTFPDTYVFTGPVARQFTQVGNAVPPVLAAQLALSIRSSFFD